MKNLIEELENKECYFRTQREMNNRREITRGRGQTQKGHYPANQGSRKEGQRIQRAGPPLTQGSLRITLGGPVPRQAGPPT